MAPFKSAIALLAFSDASEAANADRIKAREDGFMVDGFGRVRIFRGFNDIQHSKGVGYKPGGPDYLAKAMQYDFVIEGLEEMGFNTMRIPMMWAATKPFENVTDFDYLKNTSTIVKNLGRHHIHALLDMHQDVLSSRLADDKGDTGYDGAPRWVVDRTLERHAYPWPLTPPLKSWGDGYLTEATGQCFQDIYDNTHGGLDAWADFWQTVAKFFKDQESVLGYELINEPWVGDHFADPTRFIPGMAGKNLMKPYKKLSKAIREIDTETMIFFEPVTWGMLLSNQIVGSGFTEAPDPNSVFSFHYYCWFTAGKSDDAPSDSLTRGECDRLLGPDVFHAVAGNKKKLKVPAMMTEWAGKSPRATLPDSLSTVEINANLDMAEEHMTNWHMYDVVSVLPHNYADPWDEDVMDVFKVFARPFAHAVAGTPTKMKNEWEQRNGSMYATKFVLEFNIGTEKLDCPVCECGSPAKWPVADCDISCGAKCGNSCCCIAGVGSCPAANPPKRPVITEPTEIVVPPIWMPNGFTVELSHGLSWKMAPDRKHIVAVTIDSPDNAPSSGTVTIVHKDAPTQIIV